MPDIAGDQTSASGVLFKVVSGVALANGATRALLVGSAGTATLEDMNGTVHVDVPLQQGYNPLRVRKVTLGGAADVWALY